MSPLRMLKSISPEERHQVAVLQITALGWLLMLINPERTAHQWVALGAVTAWVYAGAIRFVIQAFRSKGERK